MTGFDSREFMELSSRARFGEVQDFMPFNPPDHDPPSLAVDPTWEYSSCSLPLDERRDFNETE